MQKITAHNDRLVGTQHIQYILLKENGKKTTKQNILLYDLAHT